MKIQLNKLEKITISLLKELKSKHDNEVEIDADYYWDISKNELNNPYKEPTDFSLGQLTDDWETLKESAFSDNLIFYDLKRIAQILTALSTEYSI